MLNTLSQLEANELAVDALVQRMDEILQQSLRERYGTGNAYKAFPKSMVSDVTNTKKVAALPDEEKKKIAHISFSYLVQMELNSVSSGFANILLYTQEYDEKTSWLSPLFRLRDGSIRQYQIVSSRMAMEIFMDLLHYIENGERLKSKRSKLKAFRKWLCDPSNQFHYFAHVLLEAYRFDRNLRTPEVHGTPRLPQRLLLLQNPSHEEINEPHHLSNSLLNCWRPLLDILNEIKPTYMQVSESEDDWFMTYMNGSEEEITDKLTTMFDGIE